MDAEMYEKPVNANDSLSRCNANFVLVPKPGQVQLRLLFNYYFIHEDIPASHTEAATTIHNLLSISSHHCLFLADIKHGY